MHTLGTDWSRVVVEATVTDKAVSAVQPLIDLVTRVSRWQLQHSCTSTTQTTLSSNYVSK